MNPAADIIAGRTDAIIKTPAAGLHRGKYMIYRRKGVGCIKLTNHILPPAPNTFFLLI